MERWQMNCRLHVGSTCTVVLSRQKTEEQHGCQDRDYKSEEVTANYAILRTVENHFYSADCVSF